MIAIVNVSERLSAIGEHEYEVRINQEIKAKFIHEREEGLSCLIKAAKAVEKQKWEQAQKIIESMRAKTKLR